MQSPGIWRKLHNKMLAAMENGSFMQFSGYTVAGLTFNYRSLSEFWEVLADVEARADMEDGVTRYQGRRYAGQGGRG
jgi:hypothetical protein